MPQQNSNISLDFLNAALQPREKADTKLLGDIGYALMNNKLEMATDAVKAIPKIVEGVGGTLLNAAQTTINFGMLAGHLPGTPFTSIHIPGATYKAPKNPSEVINHVVNVASLGAGDMFDQKKAEALKKTPTRKDSNGNLVSLEDDVNLNLGVLADVAGEYTGLKPMYRSLSNSYDHPVKASERAGDFVMGALSIPMTVAGAKGLVGGRATGAVLADRQLAELTMEAGRVKTANDIAKILKVGTGEDVISAAKGATTLEAAAAKEKLRTQNIDKMAEFANANGAADYLSPGHEGIPPAASQAVAGLRNAVRDSRIVDNTIQNAAGQALKLTDGTVLFVDAVDTTSPISKRLHQTMLEEALIDNPTLEEIVLKSRQSEILRQLDLSNPGMKSNHLIAASVANGVMGVEWMTHWANRLGLTPEVAQQELVNHLIHTASGAGKKLSIYNIGEGELASFRQIETWFGEQNAKKISDSLVELGKAGMKFDIDKVKGTLSDIADSISVAQKKAISSMAPYKGKLGEAGSWLMNISKIATQSMLSYIGTPIRNAENSILMHGVASFEEALIDTAVAVAGDKAGSLGAGYSATARRNAIANATFDFAKLFMGRGELARGLTSVLDAIPTSSQYLRGSGSQLMGHLAELKSTGVPIADNIFKAYGGVLNTINTFGELPARQAIYGSRLLKNVESIKHWQDIAKAAPEVLTPTGRMKFIEDWATNPAATAGKYGLSTEMAAAVDGDMRLVLGDAKLHTLKTQMSFSTEGVKKFVDFYHSIPFADALGPTFPKMTYNIYRWTAEHNPVNLFSILDDSVRESVMAGAEGGFKTKVAQRNYAKAVSGAAMFGLAYGMQSGLFKPMGIEAGARPYEFKTSDITHDIRALSPFDKYSVMARIAHNVMGKGMSFVDAMAELTPAELSDFTLSQRRVGDVPVLGLEKLFADWTSDDPERVEARAKKLFGDFIGRFSTPMRNAKLITDIIYPNDQAQADQNGSPIVGATLNHLPGPMARALGEKYDLPRRVDPTTGKPNEIQHPYLAPILQIMGSKIETLPKLTETLQQLNFPMHLLVGNNGDDRLDRAEAESMGKILQRSYSYTNPDGTTTTTTIGEYIAGPVMDKVAQGMNQAKHKDMVLINSEKRVKLKEEFSKLRLEALAEAYGKYPELALQDKVMHDESLTPKQRLALMTELEAKGILQPLRKQGEETRAKQK